jgi:hypothetical protein
MYGCGKSGSGSPLFAWESHVDEMLRRHPSYNDEPPIDGYVKYVYTIDLDHEILRVKSNTSETGFLLQLIPSQLQGAQGLKADYDWNSAPLESIPQLFQWAEGLEVDGDEKEIEDESGEEGNNEIFTIQPVR